MADHNRPHKGHRPLKPLVLVAIACAVLLPALLRSAAAQMGPSGSFDGKWLHRVPDEDHTRKNPFAHNPQAEAAGQVLFANNCAKCHGADANGRTHPPPRPSLRSARIRHATDGDLAWMLRNGNPYQGMPQWSSLPEEQRWQIIAYLRTLPPQK